MQRWLTAVVSLLVTAAAGEAQPTAVSDPYASGLEEVVVTAHREAEDVQRVPASITVLSADLVRDAGVTRPQDLTYLVPGLQVGSLPLFYMRGVGNFAGNSLQDPTVTFNFDGVYIARPTSTGGLFYDLERIEVLKGPQGTLYGRNATGGAINVMPRRPELSLIGGEMFAEYGDYNSLRVEGALNAPIGDRVALRAAFQRVRHDAYMNDGTDDQDDWAGRLSFRFEANDALTIRLVADYYDQGGHGPGATPLALNPDNRFGVTSPQGGAFYQSQRVTIAGRNWDPIPSIQHANNHHWGANTSIEWRTALGAITFLPAYRESRLDTVATASGNLVTVQEHSQQSSVEVRLVSDPHPQLRTLLGAFYFDEEIETRDGEFFRPFNQFNFSLQRPRTGVESTAVFARAIWSLADEFRVTLGARYTSEDKFFAGSYESFIRLCPPVPTAQCPDAQPFPVDISTSPLFFPPGSLTAVPVVDPETGTETRGFRILPDETASFSRTTWRAALEHDLAEQALLYTSFETGFKSGGFFYSNDSQVYRPEYVEAFTLGLKSRLLDNRLQVNVELFDWQYDDQQISKLSVDSFGSTNLRTENIGQATIRGVEVGAEYLPFLNTQLSADVQHLDATYDSYRYLTPLMSGPPVSGCPFMQTPEGFQVDCSGKRSPYAPEWTLALAVEQTFPLASHASLVARTRAHYQSRTLMGLDFLPEQHQAGYWMVDVSLSFATAADRYLVTLFGHNLTDETVVSNTFVVPFSTFTVGSLRPPRTFGLRVGMRF